MTSGENTTRRSLWRAESDAPILYANTPPDDCDERPVEPRAE
jgi:hypothetical protein